MLKVFLVFGTRPEAIKLAPVIREFSLYPGDFEVKVCVTGQHREMLDQVLSLFGIDPHYDLAIMSQNQDLYDVSVRILSGMREVFKKEHPQYVFVHGDTTTSTFAALAAFYEHIPVAHIEAGLRSGNIYSPWPEEMNRRLTGRLAALHFAPTTLAKENLLRENVAESSITVTGNTIIDALLYMREQIHADSLINKNLIAEITAAGYNPRRLTGDRRLILITGHRRENLGGGFENICKAIKILAQKYPGFDFVYPVHLNPKVKESVYSRLSQTENIFLLPPLSYLAFVFLMEQSYLILTDSGGIQEEASALCRPVLVMRDTTERPEAIAAGTAVLVGTDVQAIESHVSRLVEDSTAYKAMTKASNLYGDGRAASRIVAYMRRFV